VRYGPPTLLLARRTSRQRTPRHASATGGGERVQAVRVRGWVSGFGPVSSSTGTAHSPARWSAQQPPLYSG